MFAKTIGLAALASLGFAATVHAASTQDAPSNPDLIIISVPVDDLNLSNPSGASVVLRRIRDAAVSICGDAPDIRQAARFGRYQNCVKASVDEAVARLDHPVVTDLYAGNPSYMKIADRR